MTHRKRSYAQRPIIVRGLTFNGESSVLRKPRR